MMKKLFTLFICMGVLMLSMVSCSDEAVDVDSFNKQTILVFYPWSGGTNSSGLTSELKANVDSICAGIVAKKGLSNTRVMVFFSEKANQSILYDLQYNETTKEVDRVPVKTYEGTSYNSVDGLADIINEVKQEAEALNYAMIIGCHGCGWTYSSDWVNYPYLARPNRRKTRFFGSVNWDDAEMDVTTLSQAIEKAGIKMQYILFDACYMGNVETAYELRNATNYLIASSSEVMSYGLPYKSIWSYLNSSTPGYSSIVSGTVNFYNKSDAPYCNLAAIDCRQMDKLANIMKEINGKYSLSSTVPLDSIQPLGGFSPNLFYDLGVYVDSLKPSGYLKDQFTTQLKATVKSAQSTSYVFTALRSDDEIKVKSYSGLSISDPSKHSVAIKGREKTAWWKATH